MVVIICFVYENNFFVFLFENVKGLKDGFFCVIGVLVVLRMDKKICFGCLVLYVGLCRFGIDS